MNSRSFDLCDVLTVTTGVMLSARGMEGVYDILNFLTGDELFTHQLPRAGDWAKPLVLAEHPDLADVDTAGVDAATFDDWMRRHISLFGASRLVTARPDLWQHKDAIVELVEMKGAENVIIIAEK